MDLVCWFIGGLLFMLVIVCLSLWLELQGERERCSDLERVLKATREALKRYGASY